MRLALDDLIDRQPPDAVAFVDRGRPVTHADFGRMAARAAGWLAGQGVGRGDKVAVWLVNRIEWLALLFGAARIGATLVAVNTRYRAAEVDHILRRSGAKLLVLQLDFRGIDFPAILADVGTDLPALERIAVVGQANALPTALLGRPVVAFDPDQAEALPDRGDADLPAVLFTTSGTTRGPKLVVHPQRTLALHARRCAQAHGLDAPGAAVFAAMPFCGVFGLAAVLAALAGGAPVHVMETFEPVAAAGLMRREAITHVYASDEVYRRLMDVDGAAFPAARVLGFAAFAPGAADLARAAWARGLPLVGLYGSSEVLALFATQSRDLALEQRIEAGGRPASPDAEVRITGGEIEIRSPTNFIGYLNDPEATAEAITPDGFFRTGDAGHLRPDGSFVFAARKGDTIRLGGFLVSPVEIEDVLKTIDGVADAQVVAVETGGQRRCAAFVIGTATEDAVIAGARRMLAPFKVPTRVWQVDDFPRTQSANGTKIQRARLREMAEALMVGR